MKKHLKRILSLALSLLLVLSISLTAFAATTPDYTTGVYATVVTASDFQRFTNEAYNRFDKILGLAKADGMPTPDSVLIGGDYTMVLHDDAVPGIARIRGAVLKNYPEVAPDSIVCIQGNHDRAKPEIASTGLYDMGAYNLYVINEDDFPWKQAKTKSADADVKALAENMNAALQEKIQAQDLRPVIVLTHVPLHHTTRNGGGDNLYSSYLFDVLNENAKVLDIVYLFGHNHSHALDDYIGGAVNFMVPGDTIRIPDPDNMGEEIYNEETLNFIYTNCGYVGFSRNGDNEISTSTLTAGFIQFTRDKLRFVRYSQKGFYNVTETVRKNHGVTVGTAVHPQLVDRCWCHSDNFFLQFLFQRWNSFCKIFRIRPYCVCGDKHF